MTIWMVVGVSVIAAILSMMLRQFQPPFALLLTVGTGVLLLGVILATGVPLVERVTALMENPVIDTAFTQVLFKALGIGLLTQTASDICRDAGENALAAKAELGGQVLVLLCGLPLFEYAARLLESVIRSQAVIP